MSIQPTKKISLSTEGEVYTSTQALPAHRRAVSKHAAAAFHPSNPLELTDSSAKEIGTPADTHASQSLPYLPTRVTVNYAEFHPAWNCTIVLSALGPS
jgi:hypothetical protein